MKKCTNLDTLRCLNKSKTWFGSLELWWSLSYLMKSLLPVSFILRLRTDKKKHHKLLIKCFGETICFTYPKDKSKSQMFFSSDITIADVVKTIRKNNPTKQCSLLLREKLGNSVLVLTTASNQLKAFSLAIRYIRIASYLTGKSLSNTYLASEKTQIILGDIPAQYSK